jgi:hypothetical protein
MGTRTSTRRRRDPYSRTVVRIPEQALHERVLDLAAPLLDRMGGDPEPESVRNAVELAIAFWNAKARASKLWGTPKTKSLDDLQRKLTSKKATAENATAFELLLERWNDRDLIVDPRRVGAWSLAVGHDGEPRLACEVELPDGVEAEIPPPIEERVAIGGKFLDEVQIRQTANAYLKFPVEAHRGQVASDGSVTIHTKMPTAIALFAEGALRPVGEAQVDITVAGKEHRAMVLCDVICTGHAGHNDIAALVFKPAQQTSVP